MPKRPRQLEWFNVEASRAQRSEYGHDTRWYGVYPLDLGLVEEHMDVGALYRGLRWSKDITDEIRACREFVDTAKIALAKTEEFMDRLRHERYYQDKRPERRVTE